MAVMGKDMSVERIDNQIQTTLQSIRQKVLNQQTSNEKVKEKDEQEKERISGKRNVGEAGQGHEEKSAKCKEHQEEEFGQVNHQVLTETDKSLEDSPNLQCYPITLELMTHPGFPSLPGSEVGGCGEGADDFAMSPDRLHEIRVLCGKEMAELFKKHGIQLISLVEEACRKAA